MGPRPPPLDLQKEDGLQQPRYPDFHLDLPSPRPGDVPPALSPLDAFALHSRMLQKKFDEEAEQGRRLSRLSHQTVARQLANRVYDPQNGNMDDIAEEHSRPNTRGVAVASKEPEQVAGRESRVSQYPMLGRISRQDESRAGTPFYDAPEDMLHSRQNSRTFLEASRTASPDPIDSRVHVEAPSPAVPSLTSSMDSVSSTQANLVANFRDSLLLPQRSSYVPRSPRSMQSIRAVRQDSGDDESAPRVLSPRKFSGSSGMSSPFTPGFTHYAHRSPSMTSEYSLNGFQHSPRPALNFSRPDRPLSPEAVDLRSSLDSRRSFESRPSADIRHRPSIASEITQATSSPPQSRNGVPKPFATDTNASDSDVDSNAGRTYTYSKFTLPRGRNRDRESSSFRTSWIEKQFTWDKDDSRITPILRDPVIAQPDAFELPAEPVVRPAFRPAPKTSDNIHTFSTPRPSFGHSHKTSDHISTFSRSRPSSPASTRNSMFSDLREARQRAFSSANRSHSADGRGRSSRLKASHTPSASIATNSTETTIIAPSLDARTTSSDVTPEDHLEIGIQAHSAGQTNKSTYHLRLAAKAGLPTAMLLYALACRHGWGMRANQEEGVKWLQKAIDDTRLDEQDLDLTLSNASRRCGILDPATEASERKKRKAQFALAVYELGISYANGWGCQKDRALALRCYEVAGKWGDCDALAEAGYCYTQGLGCKKDMYKAASLYRRAAASGISMAGNSWIYKEKYNETTPEVTPTKDTRRARSRSIWGRPKKEK